MIRLLKEHTMRLLRFTERYTKTDMVYLFSGAGWMSFVRGIASVASLAVTVVLANTLEPDGFGTYKFALSLFGIVAAFSLSGMNTAVTRAVAQGAEGAFVQGYRTSMLWSAPMISIALAGALYYFLNHNTELGSALIVIAISAPFIINANIYDAFLVGRKKFKDQALLGVIYNVVPLAATALIAWLTHDALFVITTYFITSAIVTWVLYRVVVWRYRPNTVTDDTTLTYGKHLSFMSVLGNVSFQLDRVLMFHWFGAIPLALYSVATAAPQQLRYLGKVLSTLALPKFSAVSIDTLRKDLSRKVLLMLLVSVFLCTSYVLLAPYFFSLLFPAYTDAILYSQVYALTALFLPAVLLQQILTAHAQTKTLYIMQTTGPIIKTVCLFVFLPIFGIWGAIITALILEAFRLLFVLLAVWRLPSDTKTLSNETTHV